MSELKESELKNMEKQQECDRLLKEKEKQYIVSKQESDDLRKRIDKQNNYIMYMRRTLGNEKKRVGNEDTVSTIQRIEDKFNDQYLSNEPLLESVDENFDTRSDNSFTEITVLNGHVEPEIQMTSVDPLYQSNTSSLILPTSPDSAVYSTHSNKQSPSMYSSQDTNPRESDSKYINSQNTETDWNSPLRYNDKIDGGLARSFSQSSVYSSNERLNGRSNSFSKPRSPARRPRTGFGTHSKSDLPDQHVTTGSMDDLVIIASPSSASLPGTPTHSDMGSVQSYGRNDSGLGDSTRSLFYQRQLQMISNTLDKLENQCGSLANEKASDGNGQWYHEYEVWKQRVQCRLKVLESGILEQTQYDEDLSRPLSPSVLFRPTNEEIKQLIDDVNSKYDTLEQSKHSVTYTHDVTMSPSRRMDDGIIRHVVRSPVPTVM